MDDILSFCKDKNSFCNFQIYFHFSLFLMINRNILPLAGFLWQTFYENNGLIENIRLFILNIRLLYLLLQSLSKINNYGEKETDQKK